MVNFSTVWIWIISVLEIWTKLFGNFFAIDKAFLKADIPDHSLHKKLAYLHYRYVGYFLNQCGLFPFLANQLHRIILFRQSLQIRVNEGLCSQAEISSSSLSNC